MKVRSSWIRVGDVWQDADVPALCAVLDVERVPVILGQERVEFVMVMMILVWKSS